MEEERATPVEETLDPENWESMRALGHRMVDDMLDYLRTVRERPVWQHAPGPVREHFSGPSPQEPQPSADHQAGIGQLVHWHLANIGDDLRPCVRNGAATIKR